MLASGRDYKVCRTYTALVYTVVPPVYKAKKAFPGPA